MAQLDNASHQANGNALKQFTVAIRGLASGLWRRQQWGKDAGLSYGGRRDYYCQLGYPATSELMPIHYRYRYEREGLARRVVDIWPDATWAGGVALIEDEDPETLTEFEAAVIAMADRLNLWERFMRADVLAGLGRYGLLLIGAPGDMEEPLPRMESTDDILYVAPVGEERVRIDSVVQDTDDARFGLPEFYQLTLGSPATDLPGASRVGLVHKRVHWSRVIHIAEGLLDDDIYGQPRMLPVWNYLDDLLKVVGGGSEAAWRRADPGAKISFPLTTKEGQIIDLDEAAVEELERQVEDYIHGTSRVVRLRGTEMDLLEGTAPTFNRNADAIVRMLSATSGIPVRMLMGSERGELASTQDRKNFADRVAARRKSIAAPLVREFIERLIGVGALPEPREYQSLWPSVEELDEAEKTLVADRLAAANAKQFAAGLPPIITSNEIRDRVLSMAPLDESEIPVRPEVTPEGGEEGTPAPNGIPQRGTDGAVIMRAAKLRLRRARQGVDKGDSVWNAADSAARAGEEDFEAQMIRAFLVARGETDEEALRRAFESGDMEAAMASLEPAVAAMLRSAGGVESDAGS